MINNDKITFECRKREVKKRRLRRDHEFLPKGKISDSFIEDRYVIK